MKSEYSKEHRALAKDFVSRLKKLKKTLKRPDGKPASVELVANMLGVSASSMGEWFRGETIPHIETMSGVRQRALMARTFHDRHAQALDEFLGMA